MVSLIITDSTERENLVLAAQECPRDPNALLLFCKNSFHSWFIWFDLIYRAKQLSPLLPMQASGLSRDKRWALLGDRLLPRLRYGPFLFYSPSKLVTAKRFPWWEMHFNIYFLPDTLLFFYWVECVLALSEQVFMQNLLWHWFINSHHVPDPEMKNCLGADPLSKLKVMQTSSSTWLKMKIINFFSY